MRSLALGAASALVLLAASPRTQHVIYEEDFENGMPAGWTTIHLASALDPWRTGFRDVDGSKDVWHDWFCFNAFTLRDNILMTAPIDLTGVTTAYLEVGHYQAQPTSRVYNGVKVTTDGGTNWTEVHRVTGTFTGSGTIKADISAFAGNSNVQLGFHYRGVVANEWAIDNVRITTNPVVMSATALVGGSPATYAVASATPGNAVFFLLSGTGAGPLPTFWGNVNVVPPIIYVPVLVDAQGRALLTFTVPTGVRGAIIYGQAIEFALPTTVNITNNMIRDIR